MPSPRAVFIATQGGFPQLGVIYWGLYWGTLIQGNYHKCQLWLADLLTHSERKCRAPPADGRARQPEGSACTLPAQSSSKSLQQLQRQSELRTRSFFEARQGCDRRGSNLGLQHHQNKICPALPFTPSILLSFPHCSQRFTAR